MSGQEFAREFLLFLYHRGFLNKTGIVLKLIFREQFGKYPRNSQNRLLDCDEQSIIRLLHYCNFIIQFKDPNFLKISMPNLFKYRNEVAARLDKQLSTRNSNSKTLKSNQTENIFLEDREIDLNFEKQSLKFFIRIEQIAKPNYRLTSKGCYCCQKDFITESDYLKHIDFHTAASNSGFVCKNQDKGLPQQFQVSYRFCKGGYFLQFSIDNLGVTKSNIIIEKITVIRKHVIENLQENLFPYKLSSGCNEFYAESYFFDFLYEHPFIIVYTFEGDRNKRYLEQHNFLRCHDLAPVQNILNNRVFKREKLKINCRLRDYYPTIGKELCKKFDINVNENFRDYIDKKVPLSSRNICDVFRILLQMEDFTIINTYAGYATRNVKILNDARGYFVNLEVLARENRLAEFDFIVLRQCNGGIRNEENTLVQPKKNIKMKKCFILEIISTRVYFDRRKLSTDVLYNVTFEPNRLPIIYQHRALDLLKNESKLRNRLFPEDNIPNTTSTTSLNFFSKSIAENPEQREGVQNIVNNLNRHVPFLIFGPPGTGKTTVVVESILQLWKASKSNKILVTCASNTACDEIALRLLKKFKEIDPHGMQILRIYAKSAQERAANLDDEIINASNICYNEFFYPSVKTICTYSIVIATLTVCGKLVQGGLPTRHFTHVFIDECGASTEVLSLVGISNILSPSGQLILSGDPKQLGPIIECNVAAKHGLNISLLERLMNRECYQRNPNTKQYNKSIQARLVRNYRNHKDILFLSNKLYYNDELEIKASSEITDCALGWTGLNSLRFPLIFHSVYGVSKLIKSTSLCNFEELHVVMSYVKDLMYFGIKGRRVSENDIGIISPYRKQCDLIRKELDVRGWFHIQCGSVETFQGKEKSIIIVSMVRSATEFVGFLDNPKRLNVLLTRAQALLIIIGNPLTLSKIEDWKFVIEYTKRNGAYYEHNPAICVTDLKNIDGARKCRGNLPSLINDVIKGTGKLSLTSTQLTALRKDRRRCNHNTQQQNKAKDSNFQLNSKKAEDKMKFYEKGELKLKKGGFRIAKLSEK